MEVNSDINYTRYFQNTMGALYQALGTEMALTKSFDEMMGTMEGRVEFIINLVNLSINQQVSPSLFELFKTNYEFIYGFIMGEFDKKHVAVPKKIKDNIEDYRYVPTTEELSTLIDMIKINYNTYNKIYRDNELYIRIPDGTMHQNMIERLEIRKNNIAHLLGITSGKSSLAKIFVDLDKQLHPDFYDENGDIIDKENNGVAVRIVDFYTSQQGKEYLLKINDRIRAFIKSFEERNPGSVDSTSGGIKSSYEAQFKKEFEKVFNFSYPLLEYNKMFVKNVGFYNQTELSFVSEILLDYDSRKSESVRTFRSKKFLVHYDAEDHIKQIDTYKKLTTYAMKQIEFAAQLPEEEGLRRLRALKLERHSPLLYQMRRNLSTQVLENLNIRNTDLIDQINKLQNELREQTKGTTSFPYDTQMLGFIPVIYDSKEHDINEVILNCGICETNLEVSVPELIQEYYKHSSRYYVDTIRDSHGNFVRVGSIKQEEAYQYVTQRIESSEQTFERLAELQEYKEKLNEARKILNSLGPDFIPPSKSKK